MRLLPLLALSACLCAAQPAAAGRRGSLFTADLDLQSGLYGVFWAKRVLSSYTGPLYQVTRDSDGAAEDVYPDQNGWGNMQALANFAGGSALMVTTVYDQKGTGNVFTAPSTPTTYNAPPYLNMDGPHAVFDFDGVQSCLTGTALAGVAQNASSAAFMIVRQFEFSPTKPQAIMDVSIGTGNAAQSAPRMKMGSVTAGSSTVALSSEILDSDSGSSTTTGLPNDNGWHVEIGSWNFAAATMTHVLDGSRETKANYETGQLTSNTPSLNVRVGCLASSGQYFEGKIAGFAFLSGLPTDLDISYATTLLPTSQVASTPQNQFMVWPIGAAASGTYPLAPGVSTYTVQVPDGTTPSLSDLSSMRYNHHTRIGVEPNSGRIFVAHSSVGVNENDSGIMAVVESTTNNWSTEVGPLLAVPPQSPFYPAGGSSGNDYYVYPRNFQVYNGHLYLVAAVDYGYGLLAVLCNADGTIGTPFQISPTNWPTYGSGFPSYPYDPVLSPPLYAYSQVYGTWGGEPANFTSVPLSPWTGELRANGSFFVEPATINLGSNKMLRIWRKAAGILTNSVWLQISSDGGVTWTTPTKTNLPNSPSAMDAILLSNGHLAVIANPADQPGGGRDPLYIALFNGNSGASIALYAIAQGLVDVPTYPGTAKDGGPTYSGSVESSLPNGTDTLYVSFSTHGKEQIWMAAIPVSGL